MNNMKKLMKLIKPGKTYLKNDNKIWLIHSLDIGEYIVGFNGEYVSIDTIGEYHGLHNSFNIESSCVFDIDRIISSINDNRNILFFNIQKNYNNYYDNMQSIIREKVKIIEQSKYSNSDIILKCNKGDFLYDSTTKRILYINTLFDNNKYEIFDFSSNKIELGYIQLSPIYREGECESLINILSLFKKLLKLTEEYNSIRENFNI